MEDIQFKFQKGWVAYSSKNRAEYYKNKYSKIWNKVTTTMTFGMETVRNDIVGINYECLIMGYQK